MSPEDEDSLPMVPFVPFRCPKCGRHKPRTQHVRGRLRTHICLACGARYRSIELPPDAADMNQADEKNWP